MMDAQLVQQSPACRMSNSQGCYHHATVPWRVFRRLTDGCMSQIALASRAVYLFD